ncbi:hypothetical protein [Nocardia sp. NPDC051463]|uniref:hypothetical protein n=1 Tax=Nocardia sp. NPDC051463 TaxID=3154845 RepID=UPI00344BD4B3
MSRQTDDGKHEGYVTAWFADDRWSGGWENGAFLITRRADGSMLPVHEWFPRPPAEVIGWRPMCECGWRGSFWTRVGTPAEEDISRQRGHSSEFGDPSQELEDAAMREWERHIAPSKAAWPVVQAAREFYDAQDRLNDVVRQARADGASWTDIGDAAGMTRQSAHQRWSKVVD